jgi:hypothetical protein
MEDQAADQFSGADAWGTAATQAAPAQHGKKEGPWDQLLEESLESGGRDRRSVSHPQFVGVLAEKVQAQSAVYEHIRKYAVIHSITKTLTGIVPKPGYSL